MAASREGSDHVGRGLASDVNRADAVEVIHATSDTFVGVLFAISGQVLDDGVVIL